jgi:hypothetical protein
MKGKKSIPFTVPMIWREPTGYIEDWFFKERQKCNRISKHSFLQ